MAEPLLDGPTAMAIDRLHLYALALRTAADRVDDTFQDLTAFDRPDVWHGGRATAFREGLQDQYAALTTPDFGAAARLREAARRIDARAGVLVADAARASREPTAAAVTDS